MNRRLFTFFICLIVSIVFWLLMSLSKDYNSSISFPVKYINLPKNKVVDGELPETIDILIKSTGYNLLGYKLKQVSETIIIDLKGAKSLRTKNHYYLLTNSKLEKVAAQFNNGINVLKISPDSILLTYKNKVKKVVPIKLNKELTYEGEYQLADSIKIIPDKIEIAGSAEDIKDIDFIETEMLQLDDLNKSTRVKIALQKNEKFESVEMSKSEVDVKINVTKFTEASIDLPIKIENLPHEFNLKVFPDKINVKYIVAFENYEKVKEADFKLVVNYKAIEKGSSKAKVELVKSPAFIKGIKLSPEKVEYIIRK